MFFIQSEQAWILFIQSEQTRILFSQTEQAWILFIQSEQAWILFIQSEQTWMLFIQSEQAWIFFSQSRTVYLLSGVNQTNIKRPLKKQFPSCNLCCVTTLSKENKNKTPTQLLAADFVYPTYWHKYLPSEKTRFINKDWKIGIALQY